MKCNIQSIKTGDVYHMNFKIELNRRILDAGFSEVRFLKDNEPENSIVIAAFPYSVNQNYSKRGVKISPFAQKNHYGEAIKRLKKIALFVRENSSLTKKDIRLFCNSQLQEKWFAANSGLGFYGRNSLIITKDAGSRVILAGMILPIDIAPDKRLDNGINPGALCGSCRICMNTCPTAAIGQSGIINREKCLQSLTTDDRILPESIMGKWGNRLYGCSICQDCCPFNIRNLKFENSENIKGVLGDSVPIDFILRADDAQLKEFFKGTALSMSWIKFDLLRRNALLSASSMEGADLLDILGQFKEHKTIGYAARWSIKKITEQPNKAPTRSAAKSLNSIILP